MSRWIAGNKTGDEKLKQFMENRFDIQSLGNAGVFNKADTGRRDYEAMAAKICEIFSLESVYEYATLGAGTRCHISYAIDYNKPRTIPPHVKFVEVLNPVLNPVIGGKMKTAKVLSLFPQ